MAPRFPAHTAATAVGAAADRLAELEDRHGQVGDMVRTMAGSPSMLLGYLELSRAMKRSRLDRRISERVSLAVQEQLGCELCVRSHTAAARSLGVSESEIEAARNHTSEDPAVAPVVELAHRLHVAPSSVTAEDVEALRDLGLRDRDILDLAGLVALNVLTGTFNLLAGLEPEDT
ncbi:MAG TPA: carboxymuconolactone decarboxylase family protein [Acidimicrobiales bacterium]|nr:carboxymuconolactone decarboxylase family protein [Acidimicrobiales bacterium]